LLEAAWPMPRVVAEVMASRVAFPADSSLVLKAVMVMLLVARSIPQPLLSMQRVVVPLEGPVFLRGKPVNSRWVHNSLVVISLTQRPN
jgi:hypothetical protein